jgi:hypothetical protein
MANAKEPPKPIGEIIDHIERIREELLNLQKSLEKMESIDRTLDTDNQNSN